MNLIEHDDLENDLVVRVQHRYYVPVAVFFGFVIPTLLGSTWGDAIGGFVWGGLVAKLPIWHCTFLVNSLAHWQGIQPYSDDNTSRGNLILALLTGGEGNHNFHVGSNDLGKDDLHIISLWQHAFPHDFRSGPSPYDWDPSKWIILALQRRGLVYGLRRARNDDIQDAVDYMQRKVNKRDSGVPVEEWNGDTWNRAKLMHYAHEKPGRCVIVIDGYAVDTTEYVREHPGGSKLLLEYSLLSDEGLAKEREGLSATWAFHGGMNTHSRAAKKRMEGMSLAKLVD
ncbi:hypothetical protein AX16_000486 [Volvariella volvacea WC 439]|nr:hypothetical protein AX16_000486 [Volvariella volvacea WC 439]